MARLRRIRSKFRRFARIDGGRRGLLMEAALSLLIARLALVFMPFRNIARRLGEFVPPSDERVRNPAEPSSYEHIRLAEEIGWAVTRAARYVPFKAVCLPQAIAAKAMLRRRDVGSVLHFGVAKSDKPDKPLDAHAWLDAMGIEVTGYPVAREFTEVASFV
jgi:hypothetical protein